MTILNAGVVTGVGLNHGARYDSVLIQACKAALANEQKD